MWRLLALALVVAAVWGANELLPGGNGEEQLRTITGIAAGGDVAERAKGAPALPKSSKRAAVPASNVALAPASAPDELAQLMPATGQTSVATVADSVDLIAKLQQQLRRLGCYRGPPDGAWNAATRRALARFNDRLKIRTPLDEPQLSLLPVLRSYVDRACGTPCPPGTRPDAQGSCMVKEIVAAAAPAAIPLAPQAPNATAELKLAPVDGVNPGRAVIAVGNTWKLPAVASNGIGAFPAADVNKAAGMAATTTRSRLDGVATQQSFGQPLQGNVTLPAQRAEPLVTTAHLATAQTPSGQDSTDSFGNMRQAANATSGRSAPVAVAFVDATPAVTVGTRQAFAALPVVVAASELKPVAGTATQLTAAPAAARAVAVATVPPRHRRIRKTPGYGDGQFALAASQAVQTIQVAAPRRHRTYGASYTSSYGFSTGPADAVLSIVLSKR